MGSNQTMRLIWLPSGGHIGDAVMVTSLFAEALERQPGLSIQYVVRRNAPLITDLVSAYPQIQVVSVPHTLFGTIAAVFPLFMHRAVVIAPPAWDVHPFLIKLLAALLRIRGDVVVGYEDGTHIKPWSRTVSYDKHHELYIDGLRNALHEVSISTAPAQTAPHMKLRTELPEDFPFTNKSYVVIHPFPHMATFKTIPLRRWKDLVLWLRKTYPTHAIVITGAQVDREQASTLVEGSDCGSYLAIGLPLQMLAGLIEHAELYVGVDTGPTHIAGVLGVSSVVLAHQNEPTWLPGYNTNAMLLSDKEHCVCRIQGEDCTVIEGGKAYRRCVYYVRDETIQEAIREKLDRSA